MIDRVMGFPATAFSFVLSFLSLLSLKEHKKLHLLGLICAVAFGYLAVSSSYYGESSIEDLFGVSLMVGLLTILGCVYYVWLRKPLPLAVILFWACIFRLIGVLSYPILEDDHYRFLWDGYQTVESGSPYIAPPADFFDQDIPDIFEDVLNGINYPEVPTIYAPVTQAIFAIAYIIAPAQVWALKVVLLVFDMGLLLILAYLINRLSRREAASKKLFFWQSAALLFYAWSPLVIKEIAFTAHPDIVGVFFIVAAWGLQYRQSEKGNVIAVLCALAVASKIFALLLVPFLLQFYWRRWLVFVIALLVFFLPFMQDILHLLQSVKTMGQHWIFNAPAYLAFDYYAASFPHYFSAASYALFMSYIKYIGLAGFVLFWWVYFFRFFGLSQYCKDGISGIKKILCKPELLSNHLPRGDWIYAIFFLVIPVVNPWYLLWLLPFAVIYPSLWALTASFSVLLSYVIGLNLDQTELAAYDQPGWVLFVEYAVVFGVLLGEKLWLSKPSP